MLGFRLYIAFLLLVFFLLSISIRGLEFLSATVVLCGLMFLILDIRKDVEKIQELEAQIDSLTNKL